MVKISKCPSILLISQWPKIKNGEYELIEKIKKTGFKVKVVDFFGFDVTSGECLNVATLHRDYDFAISFHYDTPKFLNIFTFLWVANPLEFMHLRGDYRTVLIHHLRSYDGYLYNGSEVLKSHIRHVVGSEWRDSNLELFPSSSLRELIPPKVLDKRDTKAAHKVFYCGVNWERGIDRAGRAQGLLDVLQEQDAADFYGPNKLEGINPWDGFSSYKGEIPFDGVSMLQVMRQYGAVLAISSPAHKKSGTSSSRVFEGIAAGVPVISDENPHVRRLFGDLVYYFNGDDETERARSILDALRVINESPAEAQDRVMRAQLLMAERFCFEPCVERMQQYIHESTTTVAKELAGKKLELFLLHHDVNPLAPGNTKEFLNINHLIEAAAYAAKLYAVQVHITVCGGTIVDRWDLPTGVSITEIQSLILTDHPWDKLRLGEKVALLMKRAKGDFVSFYTQFDFAMYDAITRALDWFSKEPSRCANGLHVGGFFVSDLAPNTPLKTVGILRNNASNTTYRWTQNSLLEHQLATMIISGNVLKFLEPEKINRLDVLLPISILATAKEQDVPVHRSRHMLLRCQFGSFQRHYDAYLDNVKKGFWSQHYELTTNYNHELNALCDIHHESGVAMSIVDQISGIALPSTSQVDPAVHAVNNFISRLRPIYHWYKMLCRLLGKK